MNIAINAEIMEKGKRFHKLNQSGKDFSFLSDSKQIELVKNCIIHSAKMLNAKTDSKESIIRFVASGQQKEDIFQTAFLRAFEMSMDSKYNCFPLRYMVCKACYHAINKYYYDGKKAHDDLADYENKLYCDMLSFSDVLKADRIDFILSFVRDDLKKHCANVIDLLLCGFKRSEIAKILGVSQNAIAKYTSAIINAVAMANIADKEWNTLDKLISSDIAYKDTISRKVVEHTICKAYKQAFKVELDTSVISWNHALDRLKASAYFEYNPNALKALFESK